MRRIEAGQDLEKPCQQILIGADEFVTHMIVPDLTPLHPAQA